MRNSHSKGQVSICSLSLKYMKVDPRYGSVGASYCLIRWQCPAIHMQKWQLRFRYYSHQKTETCRHEDCTETYIRWLPLALPIERKNKFSSCRQWRRSDPRVSECKGQTLASSDKSAGRPDCIMRFMYPPGRHCPSQQPVFLTLEAWRWH